MGKSKIYTVTLSPSIDYVINFDSFIIGETNRTNKTDLYAAGKGVHVSMMLNNLNYENTAIIFFDGDFSPFFENDLLKSKLNFKKFKSSGIRTNLKLIDPINQTEVSVQAPSVSTDEIVKFYQYLLENLVKDDVVVITGSLPFGVANNVYGEIAKIVNQKQAIVVIDAFGETLTYALKENPFLIKPNRKELEITLNKKLSSINELIEGSRELIKQGAQNVLLSMDKDGAILVTKDDVIQCQPDFGTRFKLVNSAGAGDSMLAGFVCGYIQNQSLKECLTLAVACGSATAFSPRIAESYKVEEVLKMIL